MAHNVIKRLPSIEVYPEIWKRLQSLPSNSESDLNVGS
jgi:hypothetical protein